MNYIELLNNYWSLREQGIISPLEGDLYLYLIRTSNRYGWKNPFNQTTSAICAFLGINRTALINRRNKLKQIGLIDFKEGIAQSKPAIYEIMCIKNDTQGSTPIGTPYDTQGSTPTGTTTLNKTKLNKTKEVTAVAEPPPSSKKEKFEIKKFIAPENLPFSGPEFLEAWQKLLESQKWRKKPETAIEATVKMMKDYNEQFLTEQIRRAISGNWQGLFFSNTKDEYKKYINQHNGTIQGSTGGIVFDKP